MDIAEDFELESSIILGRLITVVVLTQFGFLSIQDTDFGKSLIRFADESFVTVESEEWIAFQVATTFGLDKTHRERLDWVKDNHELITLSQPIQLVIYTFGKMQKNLAIPAACDGIIIVD